MTRTRAASRGLTCRNSARSALQFERYLNTKPAEVDNRRLHKRALGPFVGRRCTLLPVPVRVHDLSVGAVKWVDVSSEVQWKLEITIERISVENPDQTPK